MTERRDKIIEILSESGYDLTKVVFRWTSSHTMYFHTLYMLPYPGATSFTVVWEATTLEEILDVRAEMRAICDAVKAMTSDDNQVR